MNRIFITRMQRFAAVILLSTTWAASLEARSSNVLNQASSDSARSALISTPEGLVVELREKQADIYSPRNFAEGIKQLDKARKAVESGKKESAIQKIVLKAMSHLTKADETAGIASVTFASTIRSRRDASESEAARHTPEEWQRAEKVFREAIAKLEAGKLESAKKKSAAAETAYRNAELQAIKINYLQETWTLLEQARELKVKDRAPDRFKAANSLIAEAEAELTSDRYNRARAISLAESAHDAARHALFLSEMLNAQKRLKLTQEQVRLSGEKPLRAIAEALGLKIAYDADYASTTRMVIDSIRALGAFQEMAQQLIRVVGERESEVTQLRDSLLFAGARYDSLFVTHEKLASKLRAQEAVEARIAALGALFAPHEAKILSEQSKQTIRLTGMSFPAGNAQIETRYFQLISRIKKAMELYPEARVTLVGHTDTREGGENKIALSLDRAEAVKQYLYANLDPGERQIEVVGAGDNDPVGNNETPEGRERNRRIDVVIETLSAVSAAATD